MDVRVNEEACCLSTVVAVIPEDERVKVGVIPPRANEQPEPGERPGPDSLVTSERARPCPHRGLRLPPRSGGQCLGQAPSSRCFAPAAECAHPGEGEGGLSQPQEALEHSPTRPGAEGQERLPGRGVCIPCRAAGHRRHQSGKRQGGSQRPRRVCARPQFGPRATEGGGLQTRLSAGERSPISETTES